MYTDPGGDVDGGPDLTRLTIGQGVMNSAGTAPTAHSRGVLKCTYTVTKLDPAALVGASGTSVSTLLDIDKDWIPEYTLVFGLDADGPYGFVEDAAHDVVAKTAALASTAAPDGTTHTVMLSPDDIGGATSFKLTVRTATTGDDGTCSPSDSTTDTWSYDLGARPLLGPVTLSPTRAVAGSALTLTLPLARSDTLRKLSAGVALTVDARIGTHRLAHTDQARNGIVTVRLAVPDTVHAHAISVCIAATLGSHTAQRTTLIPIAPSPSSGGRSAGMYGVAIPADPDDSETLLRES